MKAKIANTATMISAALVIVPALAARPWATAVRLSPVAWNRSLMRDSMKTS